jgi:hypothetical protein
MSRSNNGSAAKCIGWKRVVVVYWLEMCGCYVLDGDVVVVYWLETCGCCVLDGDMWLCI